MLPGGYGTLLELSYILQLNQLSTTPKPCFLFNYKGFWEHIINHLDQLQQGAFIDFKDLTLFSKITDLNEIIK